MRTKLFGLIVAIGAFALAGCHTPSPDGGNAGVSNKPQSSGEDAQVAFSLVTGAQMLPVSGMKRAIDPEHQAILDEVNQLEVFFLNSEDSLQIVSEPSDRPEYESKEVITYADSLDTTATMTLYYNSFDTSDWDDVNETEINMRGVALIGQNEYPFTAESESETEIGESEFSLETRIYTSADRRSYIATERESESEGRESEESYTYVKVENMKTVETYSMSLENEHNAEEKEILLSQGGKSWYVKTFSRNGKTYISIATREQGQKTYVTYEQTVDAQGNIDYIKVER